jgi:hypothetical protein
MDKSPLILRVTVVGLTGKQASVLRQEVGRQFDLRILTLERALRVRANASDVVITTRFIGHKHERHLRRVSGCPVLCLQSGCAQAVANAVRSFAGNLGEAA